MATATTTVSAIALNEIAMRISPGHGSQLLDDPAPAQGAREEVTPTPVPAGRVFDAAAPQPISRTSRFLVISLVVAANFVQFTSNFVTLAGGLRFSELLGREVGPGKANWMAASYSLTQGAFVLITGRLGEIFGHQRMVLLGSAVFAAFSLANGFCSTYESFVAMRALSGVGGGVFMPNAVALITTMVAPGRTRNIALGFFASAPPIGGVVGGLLAGVFLEMAPWVWLFVAIAASAAVIGGWLAYLMPRECPTDTGGKIDYIGATMGLGSLLLFNVAWNEAPAVGWSSTHVITIVVFSVVLFAAFIVWEGRYAKEPIMPLHVFRAPTFAALVLVVLLTYMGFGISLWYSISWQYLLRASSVLQIGVNFIPFGLGSVVSVGVAAWLIPRVAAQWIMAVGVATVVASNLLLATMPVRQTFWAQAFAAVVASSFCPDFVYVAAQLIASNSVGRRHQGVAGSLVGTLNLYGNSLGIGFAGTIETQVGRQHGGEGGDPADLVRGFRAALYFGMALAAVALALDFAFVRMPKDEREGWEDPEDEQVVAVQASATAVERQI